MSFKEKLLSFFLKNKLFFRTIFYLVALIIVLFLARGFLQSWQKINNYEWQFDYRFLSASVFFFVVQNFFIAVVWRKIILQLEPQKTLSYFSAIRIHVFAIFGKYLPGISWAPIAKLYFGKKHGFNGQKLAVSIIYENLMIVISGFIVSLLSLSTFFYGSGYRLYFISGAVVLFGLVLTHSRVFYSLVGLAGRILKQGTIEREEFFETKRIAEIIFYYSPFFILGGMGLFFLIKSVFYISFAVAPAVIGAYALAVVSGVVALFAPAGLGVRESILIAFLSPYLSLESAILISILARIFATIGEALSFAIVFIASKFIKNNIN